MARRRLALVGPFAPLRGGIAQFNDRFLEELSAAGHEVLPVSFSRQYPDWLFPGTSQIDPGRSGPALRLIDSINPLSWRRAGRAIRDFQPEASIYAYWTPHLAPALSGVAQRAGSPALGLIHNLNPHGGQMGVGRMLMTHFLKQLTGVLTLSQAVAGQVADSGFKAPVVAAHHPPYDHFGTGMAQDDARKALGLSPTGPVLLCFGLVRSYKGFDLAVRAVDLLVQDFPDLQLVIAGEAYGKELDTLLAGSIRDHVVRHARYIPDSEVARYYSAADLLLLPYRSATQSGPLATASHYSLPVVVTDVGALGDAVRRFDSGTVSQGTTAQALAVAIRRGLSPDRLARTRKNMAVMAVETGWPRLVDRLTELMDSNTFQQH